MAGGRPTDYKPEYCELIVEYGREGLHTYQIAGKFEVVKSTLYNWAELHPEFMVAFTRARELSKAYMIKHAMDNLGNKNYQSKLWEVLMKFCHDVKENRTLKLPELKKAKSFSAKAAVIIDAMSEGRLTPDEAKTLVDTIAVGAKIEEVTELKERLEVLAEKIKNA